MSRETRADLTKSRDYWKGRCDTMLDEHREERKRLQTGLDAAEAEMREFRYKFRRACELWNCWIEADKGKADTVAPVEAFATWKTEDFLELLTLLS